MPAAEYILRRRRVLAWMDAVDERLAGFDAFATPTISVTAPALEEVAEPDDYRRHNVAASRNAAILSLFDVCAVTLPVALDAAGVPVGLQLAARRGKRAGLDGTRSRGRARAWAPRASVWGPRRCLRACEHGLSTGARLPVARQPCDPDRPMLPLSPKNRRTRRERVSKGWGEHMTDRVRRLTGALLGAACVIAGAGVAAAADTRALEICVVHNNADHPSITAIVNGMNDEAAIYGAKVTTSTRPSTRRSRPSMIEDCIARKPGVDRVNAVDPGDRGAGAQEGLRSRHPGGHAERRHQRRGPRLHRSLRRLAVLRPGLRGRPDDREGDRRQGQPRDDHRQARPVRRRAARGRHEGSVRRRRAPTSRSSPRSRPTGARTRRSRSCRTC